MSTPVSRRPIRFAARRAFTLVELLVVIAILALLISLLLPTLHRATASARKTKCLSNQRALVSAYLLYANDHKGVLVHPGQGAGRNPGWLAPGFGLDSITNGALFRYLKTPAVYQCPADTIGPRSYSINAYLDPAPTDTESYWTTRLERINRPSATFVFIDCNETGLGSPAALNNGSFAISTAPNDLWRDRPGTWHGDGASLSFADGHGEYIKWKDRRTQAIGVTTMANGTTDIRTLQSLLGVEGAVPITKGPCCKDGTCTPAPGVSTTVH